MEQQATRQTNVVQAEQLGSLLAGWAEASHGTLAQQLAHALRGAVLSGVLADGSRLPAERVIAAALAVSRSTVTSALDELRTDGTVESRQGSGTVVRNTTARTITGTRIAEHFFSVPGIDLAAGNPPDASHLPPIHVDVAALLARGGDPGCSPWASPPCGRRWPTATPGSVGSPTPARST